MNHRGRPSGSPLRRPFFCLADSVASPSSGDAQRRPPFPEAMPHDLYVPATNERVGMNHRGRPSGSPLRRPSFCLADSVASPSSGDAQRRPPFPRHCLALIRRRAASSTISRGHASRLVCPGHERARRHESPRATQWVAPTPSLFLPCRLRGLALIRRRAAAPSIPEALPRPHPATRSGALHSRGHASRLVCPGHERARRHESPRATQWVAPTPSLFLPCRLRGLALIRRRPASPTFRGTASPSSGGAQRRPPFPEAMPHDLYVPATNERVGMNHRGRPSGSPLRRPFFLPCRLRGLALIRRRAASSTFRGTASRLVCPGHERARRHESPRATQWVAPTPSLFLPCRLRGLALIRRRAAAPSIPEAMPHDLYVPATNERVGMNHRGRPSGSPLRRPFFCLADSVASPSSGGAQRRPPFPEAMPHDLYVPATNERVGMNHRGRPSGSPLRRPFFCLADSVASPLLEEQVSDP